MGPAGDLLRVLLRLVERAGTLPRSLLASLALHAGVGVAFGLGVGWGGGGAEPRRELLLALEDDGLTLPLPEELPAEPAAPVHAAELSVDPPPLLPEEPPPLVEPEVEREAAPPDEEPVCELPPAGTWLVRLAPPRPAAAELPAPRLAPPRPAQAAEPTPITARNDPPRYPFLAIRQRLEGTVWVRVEVDAQGAVVRCELDVSSGHGILDRAAIAALGRWRFDGGPGTTRVPVVFRLTDR